MPFGQKNDSGFSKQVTSSLPATLERAGFAATRTVYSC
jgi:hypothetical protein